jgi:chromosome segregation ATPase
MTRWPVLLVLLLTAAFVVGCKDSDGATAAGGGDPASAKQQEDLLARRDALLRSRQQILDEQAKLDAERAELVQSGADTSEVDKKKEELASKEQALASQETQLLDAFQSQLAELSALRAAGADQTARVAARETSMATREKTVASREATLASREAALADRERRLAVRERETCSASAVPTTIIQTVDAKGSKYSKKDVEPVLRRAREAMAKKGILAADLPAAAQELEREATGAMASGDYGAAYLAARTLATSVDGVRIDRAFISAKIGRLSQRMKGVKLDDGKQKQVDQLFADATSRYGDGDFAGANRKLNQIVAMIQ